VIFVPIEAAVALDRFLAGGPDVPLNFFERRAPAAHRSRRYRASRTAGHRWKS